MWPDRDGVELGRYAHDLPMLLLSVAAAKNQ